MCECLIYPDKHLANMKQMIVFSSMFQRLIVKRRFCLVRLTHRGGALVRPRKTAISSLQQPICDVTNGFWEGTKVSKRELFGDDEVLALLTN